MYPSLRGGNNNPKYIEDGYGEMDDVIAAARYLASLPYVDLGRIYLGGHSTGGTLAMLSVESTTLFRAVFAFGPVGSYNAYGADKLV
jgi:dipeptidyl aminopeptidase/acylaminoacyl peptidase